MECLPQILKRIRRLVDLMFKYDGFTVCQTSSADPDILESKARIDRDPSASRQAASFIARSCGN